MEGDKKYSHPQIVSAMISRKNEQSLVSGETQRIDRHQAMLIRTEIVLKYCLPDDFTFQSAVKQFLSTKTPDTSLETDARSPHLRLVVPVRTQQALAEHASDDDDVSKVIMENVQRLMQDPKAQSALRALYKGPVIDPV